MTHKNSNILICSRCDDELEFTNSTDGELDSDRIKLSINEMSFIRGRFSGPLCVACINQLKTSYKILKGDYIDPVSMKVEA